METKKCKHTWGYLIDEFELVKFCSTCRKYWYEVEKSTIKEDERQDRPSGQVL